MGRKRQPTAVHELKGTYKHDPQRRPGGEPTPKRGIGEAPEHLNEVERGCWDELVNIICPGVLGDSDRWAVERIVTLMASARTDPEKFSAAAENALYRYLSALGMTPSDRGKITVPDQGKKNPFSAL